MFKFVHLVWLLGSVTALAIDKPPEADLDEDAEDALVLEVVTVTGQARKLSLKHETRLRIIRQAWDQPRSRLKKDRDKMVCWLATPTGTHFQHVTCARNGDLESMRTHNSLAGYGRRHFRRSILADNSATIRATLAHLSDTGYFDKEFVAIASSGGQPPKDVPDVPELKKFAKAWLETENLKKTGQTEAKQIEAITTQGLTLKRYNRLVELTASHQSIKNKVTELVVELRQS